MFVIANTLSGRNVLEGRNRCELMDQVDTKNQLTNATPVGTQTCDDNGNLLYAAGSYHGYAYDDENRLVNWYYYGAGYDGEGQPTSSEDWRTDLVYDGLGRLRKRVEYEVGGLEWWVWSETYYIYDGMRVIQERGDATVSYTRGSDLSGTLEGAGGIGGLLARSPGSTHSYYHADGGGNVTYLVNSSQGLAASYRYDAYGNLVSYSGTLALANVYRFSSKEQHANSGLYYYGYRWYHPNLQRWPNRDPIGERGGVNLYRFANNHPVGAVDDFGFRPIYHAEVGNSSGNPVAPPFFPRPYPPPPADPNLVGGWDDGYTDCWLLCMLGLPTAAHVAAEAGGAKRVAGVYYHYTDGRFTAWGRKSKVLVPRFHGRIGAIGLGVGVCEALICADKCWRETNRADPDPTPEPPYFPPYSGGPVNTPPVIVIRF